MGNVRFGPPTDLIRALATRFSIHNFIETGTYLGGTSAWAATEFKDVWTSELHPDSFHRAKLNLEKFRNVRIYNEASPSFLDTILTDVKGRAFFWLDAHMMPGSVTAGLDHECPVLDEIRSIIRWSKLDSYIFVDDARLFLAPAALPHKAEQWPSVREILDAFEPLKSTHHIIVNEDILMVVPLEAKGFLVDYCQQRAKQERDAERKGSRMMASGARQIAKGVVRTAKDVLRWISSRSH